MDPKVVGGACYFGIRRRLSDVRLPNSACLVIGIKFRYWNVLDSHFKLKWPLARSCGLSCVVENSITFKETAMS